MPRNLADIEAELARATERMLRVREAAAELKAAREFQEETPAPRSLPLVTRPVAPPPGKAGA